MCWCLQCNEQPLHRGVRGSGGGGQGEEWCGVRYNCVTCVFCAGCCVGVNACSACINFVLSKAVWGLSWGV